MARTSAKAKKSRQEVLKSKAEEAQKEQSAKDSEENDESTDKENEESNYEVEKIVHSRLYHGKKQYLVRWKGYSDEGDTWENESVLNSCPDVLEAFKKENMKKEKAKTENSDEKNSEDENEIEENAKAKKKGKQKSAKKITTEEEPPSEDNEENGVAKKRPLKGKKEAATLPPKKAKRDKIDDDEQKDDVEKEKDYEVEKILEVHTRKDGRKEFLIRWKGYRPSEDTWEPEAHLDCAELIEKFMEKVEKAKSIPARELRESRNPVDRFNPGTGKVHGRSKLRRNMGFRGQYQE